VITTIVCACALMVGCWVALHLVLMACALDDYR
jgi:hypothetical protein